jgi:hypothetical protein
MTATRWDLWVQGRIRTRIALVDGGEEALAELSRRKGRAGRAEDRDGGEWEVAVTDDHVTVSRDGVTAATVDGGELRVGDRTLGWALYPDGLRTLEVTGPDDEPLLQAAPGPDDEPWAVITFTPDLPEPLAVALAACFALLRAEPQVGASFLDALPDLPLP